jgi:hypothetical protein
MEAVRDISVGSKATSGHDGAISKENAIDLISCGRWRFCFPNFHRPHCTAFHRKRELSRDIFNAFVRHLNAVVENTRSLASDMTPPQRSNSRIHPVLLRHD